MKKLVVFGGLGFVGGVISTQALNNWEVTIFDTNKTYSIDGIPVTKIDISDRNAVIEGIRGIRADTVVNVAAISNIDFAEKNKKNTWDVNVCGAEHIAEACRMIGAKYIYFSSDAVFDGTKELYYEEDFPNPVNYYGKSKAEAEKRVMRRNSNSVIIRISLVLGYPVTGGNAFFLSLKKKLKNDVELAFPVDEFRTPVDVKTLSEAVLELAENDFRGILHIGAIESINRYKLTQKIIAAMGYDPLLVKQKRSSTDNQDRVQRHKKGIISVKKAQKLLQTNMLTVNEGIERAIKGY